MKLSSPASTLPPIGLLVPSPAPVVAVAHGSTRDGSRALILEVFSKFRPKPYLPSIELAGFSSWKFRPKPYLPSIELASFSSGDLLSISPGPFRLFPPCAVVEKSLPSRRNKGISALLSKPRRQIIPLLSMLFELNTLPAASLRRKRHCDAVNDIDDGGPAPRESRNEEAMPGSWRTSSGCLGVYPSQTKWWEMFRLVHCSEFGIRKYPSHRNCYLPRLDNCFRGTQTRENK